MTDQELKQNIIDRHFFKNQFIGSKFRNEIMSCMEEWAGIISKRTEDNLLEEMGFTDDPDRFNSSLDDVFGEPI